MYANKVRKALHSLHSATKASWDSSGSCNTDTTAAQPWDESSGELKLSDEGEQNEKEKRMFRSCFEM